MVVILTPIVLMVVGIPGEPFFRDFFRCFFFFNPPVVLEKSSFNRGLVYSLVLLGGRLQVGH